MTDLALYREFLESKFKFSRSGRITLDPATINPDLKPLTRELVRWAVSGGRRAIFAAFGLHKTATQIEIMRQIGRFEPGHRLIVLPLGVRQEFRREAETRFAGDYAVRLKFIRSADELEPDGPGAPIYMTNYETIRDGKLDPNAFIAATLDEASVLRSFGSKTYQTFLTLFDQVRYRFVATATPSPNRYKELIHYAGFLGVMDTGQALTRFFQRDSTQANNLTLYPHMEREFFTWLHSWAIFVQRPSDLGFDDDGYTLPALDVRYHELSNDALGKAIGTFDRRGEGTLIADASLSLATAATEKRESIDGRVAAALDIIRNDPDAGAHWLLWSDLEAERHAIQAAIPEAVSVYGSQDLDDREQAILDFSDGKFRFLSTKPELAGSGCNFQRHCHKAIFVGIGYKFNDFIQSIYRIQRFGQQHPVEIHIIYTESERNVLVALQAKWAEDTALRERMSAIIREHGLATTGLEGLLARSIGVKRRVARGDAFEAVHNDCVEECAAIATDSIGLALTSIPFGNHYEYAASYNDFGHNQDHPAFFRQMDYLTPQLLRVLMPGRMLAVHVKDRIRFGNVTGYGMPSVEPFHADCIAHYRSHGFIYCGMITVVTDVVRENNQTYRLGWSEQCKDGSKMGVGSPEYVLLFRKLPTDTSKGYADVRVEKSKDDYTRARWQLDAHAFWRSSGNRFMTADELAGYGPDTVGKLFEQLVPNTMRRIARGVDRFVVNAAKPFIVPVTHQGDARVHSLDEPMRTVTGANRGEFALITPYFAGVGGRMGQSPPRPVDEPYHTITSKQDTVLVEPFLVPMQHDNRPTPLDEPLQTVTTQGNKFNLVAPVLVPRYGERDGQLPRTTSVEQPMGTIVPDGNQASLACAFLAKHYGGNETPGSELSDPIDTITSTDHNALIATHITKFRTGSVGSAMDEPMPTVTANSFIKRPGGAVPLGVVAAHLQRDFGQSVGSDVAEPMPTITGGGNGHAALVASSLLQFNRNCDGRALDQPLPTITSQGEKFAEVRAFLVAYYGSEQAGGSLNDPLRTVTSNDRFALVKVQGVEYAIVDIGMRMLTARELATAQGFPASYILETKVSVVTKQGRTVWRRVSPTAQKEMVGNSVNPQVARALVLANLGTRSARERVA